MTKFRGRVNITGWITVDGVDQYEADNNAQRLSVGDILELFCEQRDHIIVEVFPDEFPEEV